MLECISVVATDLDGTLLTSAGTISARTRAALAEASEAGLTVIVVTTRPHRAVQELELRDVHGLAICANGALLVDLDTDAVMSSTILEHEHTTLIAERLRALVPGIAFAVETHDFYGYEPHYVNKWPTPPGSPTEPIEDLTVNGVLKLLGRHDDIHIGRLQEIVELVGGSASVTCSEGDGLIEFGPAAVSKGTGLSAVVAMLGRTSHDVVAIGDMPNDLPMLGWARVGAAVANAHPTVIEAADIVLPSNDLDGVAQLIDRILRSR